MAHKKTTLPIRRSLFIALQFQIAWVVIGLIFEFFDAKVVWSLALLNAIFLWAPALFMLTTRMKLPDSFQYGFAAFITASSFVGSVLGGYGSIANWDTIVHVYSGTLLAWFGFIVAGWAEESMKKPLPLWFKNTFALMTPLAFAVAWEIYEYMSDQILGTIMQSGGLEDTIIDMIAALAGAGIALVASLLWASYRPKS